MNPQKLSSSVTPRGPHDRTGHNPVSRPAGAYPPNGDDERAGQRRQNTVGRLQTSQEGRVGRLTPESRATQPSAAMLDRMRALYAELTHAAVEASTALGRPDSPAASLAVFNCAHRNVVSLVRLITAIQDPETE